MFNSAQLHALVMLVSHINFDLYLDASQWKNYQSAHAQALIDTLASTVTGGSSVADSIP